MKKIRKYDKPLYWTQKYIMDDEDDKENLETPNDLQKLVAKKAAASGKSLKFVEEEPEVFEYMNRTVPISGKEECCSLI